jgi:phosphoglycerol transferase
VALGGLLVVGVLDQVPVMELGAGRGGSDSLFAEDRAFTRAIEARLPAGAMVFQLPHATIPVDRGSRSRMTLYDPGRAYLHSRSLRWSWGSVIGRTHDWQAAVGALPPGEMLPLLAIAGFSGVWLDRNGYSSGPGPRFDAIENELAQVSGETPLVSLRGRYSFVSIELYRRRIERELGPERLELRRLELLSDAPVLRWRKGCSDEKPAGNGSRTCGRATSFVLNNPAWTDLEVTLAGEIRPAAGRGVLRFSAPGFEDEVDLARGLAPYRRVLVLKGAQRLRVNLEYVGECPDDTGPCFEMVALRASTRPARRVVPSFEDGAMPDR